jgi:hypothetical protein
VKEVVSVVVSIETFSSNAGSNVGAPDAHENEPSTFWTTLSRRAGLGVGAPGSAPHVVTEVVVVVVVVPVSVSKAVSVAVPDDPSDDPPEDTAESPPRVDSDALPSFKSVGTVWIIASDVGGIEAATAGEAAGKKPNASSPPKRTPSSSNSDLAAPLSTVPCTPVKGALFDLKAR